MGNRNRKQNCRCARLKEFLAFSKVAATFGICSTVVGANAVTRRCSRRPTRGVKFGRVLRLEAIVVFDVLGEFHGNKPRVPAVSTRGEFLPIHACDFMLLSVLRVVDNTINSRGFDFVSRFEFLSNVCSHGLLPKLMVPRTYRLRTYAMTFEGTAGHGWLISGAS